MNNWDLTDTTISEKNGHVFRDNKSNAWGFWDETEQANGPFDTEDVAISELGRYIHWLDTGEVLPK